MSKAPGLQTGRRMGHRDTEAQRRARRLIPRAKPSPPRRGLACRSIRHRRPLCLCVSVAPLFLLLLAPGCVRNFGTGGTGEMVVPRRVLREVEAIDVSRYAVPAAPLETQPTTTALTRPSTRPAPAEQPITVEEVRRLALRNNLDLRVALVDPAIARTSVSEEQARYEALFTANVDYGRFDSPTASR